MGDARTFAFRVPATVTVAIEAPDEQAARKTLSDLRNKQFEIGFLTPRGQWIDNLQIGNGTPQLESVDGERPKKRCRAGRCRGFVVGGRCTSAACPTVRR